LALALTLLAGAVSLAPSDVGAGAPIAHAPVRQAAIDGAAPTSVLDRQALGAFFDDLILAQLDRRRIPGAVVAVVRGREVTFVQGYGLADVDRRVPVDPETTLFHIGSNGKLFTWTAVMQLVEQGRLDLNVDINTYLDFRVPATYPEPITLAHLMTHTAGFENRDLGWLAPSPEAVMPLGRWLAANLPSRVRPPGREAGYSNYGTALAGYIVERVAGVSYPDYVEERLLVLVGLALLVVSLIAQGGLAGATTDFASGRSSSLGRAWRTGLHLFWRYAGLWLVWIATVALIGAAIAAFVALVVGLSAVVQHVAWVVAPAVLGGLLLIPAGIAAGVVASIVVPFAQRAIAVRDIGPLAALRDGWLVLRSHPGASLLVWLIDVGLSVAAGLAVTAVMIAAIAVLGIPALALWALFEMTTPTIAYLAIAAVAAFGVLLVSISVANTFFWSYWTVAYLRLRAEQAADAVGRTERGGA
jgi:hypothetical protein